MSLVGKWRAGTYAIIAIKNSIYSKTYSTVNYLVKKHNAETSKIKKLKYYVFLIMFFSVSHPVSTQDTNIISKTLAQGMILVEGKYDMWYGKSHVILCLLVSKCCSVSTIPHFIASIN